MLLWGARRSGCLPCWGENFHDLHVLSVDGTLFRTPDTPDTPENTTAFGFIEPSSLFRRFSAGANGRGDGNPFSYAA